MSKAAATRHKPLRVTAATFPFKVLRASTPVLVDFYADWCRTCQALDPVLDELAEEYGGRLQFAKLDIERDPAMASRHAVRSIPTLVLFVDGAEVNRVVNVTRKAAIVEEFHNFLE
jgi:thioredoxin 1